MSELKYKVGDRVKIKGIDWYNKYKDEDGDVSCGEYDFVEGMKKFCSEVFTISENVGDGYLMLEDKHGYVWTDEMIECKVEEETKSEDELLDDYEELTDRAFKGGYEKCKSDIELNGFQLPEGYIFKDENGNVINATKIVLEKKKKEYPKTYEECLSILGTYNGLPDVEIYNAKPSECTLFESLIRLKRCRDAYWKIAGEEMGLGKPWENGRCEVVYSICRDYDNIVKQDDYWGGAHIFEFPIREMRDAFEENFDPDIEICKEFL